MLLDLFSLQYSAGGGDGAGDGTTGTTTPGTSQPATEEAKDNNNGGMSVTTIIIFAVLIVGVIALFVWQWFSGKKKRKEAESMVNMLKVGDRVKTIGGICGFVAEINDAENTFVLETGTEMNKSYVKFDKGAIYQTAPAQGSAVQAPEAKSEEAPTTTENTAELQSEQPKKKGKNKKKAKSSEPVTEEKPVKEDVFETTEEESK